MHLELKEFMWSWRLTESRERRLLLGSIPRKPSGKRTVAFKMKIAADCDRDTEYRVVVRNKYGRSEWTDAKGAVNDRNGKTLKCKIKAAGF